MTTEQGRVLALAAGGTGGHMFPAEALAQEMRRRGWRIILFTDARGMRFGVNFPADDIVQLSAANPSAGGIMAKFSAGVALLRGLSTALMALKKNKPEAVVGFGGYPSAPAMIAARLLGLQHGVHEQNAVLGRVNRLVAPNADFVAHAFGQLSRLPAHCKGEVIQLGNPVRDAIQRQAEAAYVKPADFNKLNLFVFGGSQGASLFSRIVPEAVAGLPTALQQKLTITQQVREDEIDTVQTIYNKAGVPADLAAFFADMPERLTNAHLVISRAGASSVTELATVGRPAILVPLGIAMDDHQTGNANVLVEAGAAELLPEKDFTPQALQSMLERLLTSPERLAQMAARACSAAKADAANSLADLIEGLPRNK